MSDGEARLPAHVEISGLIRAVQAEGGFATVLSKGERDAGTILVICCENGRNGRLYERMPDLDGGRKWALAKSEDVEKPSEFSEYWQRRAKSDPDCWVLELDIDNGERFVGIQGTES